MAGIWWWVGAVLGFGAGAVARWWVGRLRRGVVLPFGPVEGLGVVLVPVGLVLTQGRVDAAIPSLLLVMLILLLAPVDAVTHRLPDAITLPALPATAVVLVVTTVLGGLSWIGIGRSLVGAVVVGALALGTSLLSPRSLGLGDVKLVPTLAMTTGFLSFVHLGLALVLAVVAAGLWSLGGLLLRRLDRRSAVPMGPFLLVAAWFVVSWSW